MQKHRCAVKAFIVAALTTAAALTAASCNGSQVTPPGPLSITSGSPPNGTVGVTYPANSLAATGGSGGYRWSWRASPGSTLPPGLGIGCLVLTPPGHGCNQPQAISGVPTAGGTYNVVATVTDGESPPQHVSASYTIKIAP